MSRQQQQNDEDYSQILRTTREYLDLMHRLAKSGRKRIARETMKADTGNETGEDDMGLVVSNTGGDYVKPPTGTHRAVCYGIVDLGTQTGSFGPKKQVLFQWELTDELMDDGRPFSISKRYTASLNEKSTLRHDLESWRGRAFTAEELQGFSLPDVIGAPCLLNVIEEPRRDGQGTYAKIAAVSRLPKGMEKPTQINASTVFDMDAPDATSIYDSLPEWLQKIIAESVEWQAKGQAPAPAATPPDASVGVPAGEEEMDIPF